MPKHPSARKLELVTGYRRPNPSVDVHSTILIFNDEAEVPIHLCEGISPKDCIVELTAAIQKLTKLID